jgi:hypothetical protein
MKMKRIARATLAVVAGGVVAAALGSCVGMHGQSTLDAIQGSIEEKKPFVEAWIEYSGPQERWAGPSSLIVHVTAKDGGAPMVALVPDRFTPEAGVADFSSQAASLPAGPGRAPGSESQAILSTTAIRDRLAVLGTALSQPTSAGAADEGASGCLSPIHARLVRSDGSIVEKRGCRSGAGWAFQASAAAADLVALTPSR